MQSWMLRPEALVGAIEQFRADVHADPQKVFAERMPSESAAVFRDVADQAYKPVFPKGTPPAMFRRVWGFFFDTSIYVIHYAGPKTALVAFYNPWTDVAAILLWDEGSVGPRIGDAEVVTGDYLRGQRAPPWKLVPGWRRLSKPPPLAVAENAYQTTEGFVRLFGPLRAPSAEELRTMTDAQLQAELKRLADWRAHAPGMQDRRIRGGNRLCAGARLRMNLFALDVLASTKALAPLRTSAFAALEKFAAGQGETVLAQARHTPAPVREVVLRESPERWGKQSVVCYGLSDDVRGGFVFTTRWDEPNTFWSLVLASPGVAGAASRPAPRAAPPSGPWTPMRSDCINFQGYFRARQQDKTGAPAADAPGQGVGRSGAPG